MRSMPLRPVAELLEDAQARGYAVGYFESWNLESLQGVVDAAEAALSPIIIGFNGEMLSRPDRRGEERLAWYAALGRAAAESASVPCGLLFNECSRDEWIRLAVRSGFGQVMLDDDASPPEEYVRRVRELVEYARPHGVAVEAQVGHLGWGASGAAAGGLLTDPERAGRFVAETGVDILAVSVGNVHARLAGVQGLDLDRLAAIGRAARVPLDLHGGTGIEPADLRRAIALGVAKVCYGTYVKQRYLAAVREALNRAEPDPHQLLGHGGDRDVMVAGRLAVREAVLERLELLGSGGRA
jgi:ketose-bisphosphate aldolase